MTAEQFCELVQSYVQPDALQSCATEMNAGVNDRDQIRMVRAVVTRPPAVCVDLPKLAKSLEGGIVETTPERARIEGTRDGCQCIVNVVRTGTSPVASTEDN